jgi:type IV secretion system protein VirB4
MKNYHTVIENQDDEFVAKNLNPDLYAISASNTGRIGDFCESQVTITIYSDDANFFQDKVNKFLSVISNIGLVVVREDFNMASCLWSQLPGNIKFAVRKRHTATSLACNFTSLHHSNMGCYNGSKWGPAITIFRNLDGNPYYFNFHNNNNGNTIIIGVKGSGKNTLQRFFLTNATKIKPRIIYLDFEGRSETFIDAIGGLYIKPDPEDFSPIKINLLDSELFANSSEVLQMLLTHAILPFEPKNENYEAFFSALTQKLFFEEPIEDKIGAIKGVIESSDDFKLKEGFSRFLGSAIYENFFDEDFLDIFSLEDIISIDLSDISKNKQFIDLYIPALLLKIKTLLDGKPTIICINQANIMFNNLLLKEFAAGFLKELTEKNAIAFLSSDYTEDLIKNDCFKECMDEFATQIYLSNKLADKEFKKTFKLTDQELYKVKSYDVERRMFLLKQGSYSIVGVLNLNGIDDVLTTLA